MFKPLTTQLVGSYVKPNWLLRHDRVFRLDGSAWRPEPEQLEEARQDSARLAIYEQERAGLDLLTDGEAQRAAYNTHFFACLGGIDATHLAIRPEPKSDKPQSPRREGHAAELEHRLTNVARIIGPVQWQGPLSVHHLRFLKSITNKPVKTTVIGPLSSLAHLADEYYHDDEAALLDLAAALNAECLALDAEGVDAIQIDEPGWHTNLSLARKYGPAVLARTIQGVKAPVIVHVCYGYAYFVESKAANPAYAEVLELLASCDGVAGISLEYEQPGHEPELLRHCGDKHLILGLLNLGSHDIETPEHIAARLRDAGRVVPFERLHPAPDCGLWHLPRDVAFGKIDALVRGTGIVRAELGLA